MIVPEPTARALLVANLERLMKQHEDRNSPDKLSKVCIWPQGSTKAGKHVAPRSLRYALGRTGPSPTLDLLVAVADAFDVPVWELLVDQKQLVKWVMSKVMSTSDTDELDDIAHAPPGYAGRRIPKVAAMRRERKKS